MLDVQRRHGGSVIGLIEVDPEKTHLYGCAAIAGDPASGVVDVTDLVEKPEPGEAPSNLAIIGRYVLDPAVFDALRDTKPGRGGEIQLTDALKTLITTPAENGGGCVPSCSGVGDTTPVTGWTICVRPSDWRPSAPTWGRSSDPSARIRPGATGRRGGHQEADR